MHPIDAFGRSAAVVLVVAGLVSLYVGMKREERRRDGEMERRRRALAALARQHRRTGA